MTTCPHSDLATKQERLDGDELLAFIEGNTSMNKTQMCLGAGYIRDTNKPAFTDFYEAILKARNIPTNNEGTIDFGSCYWYDTLTTQDQELYDMIEYRCPEFEKLDGELCREFMDTLSEHGITTAEQFRDAYFTQFDYAHDESHYEEFTEWITTEVQDIQVPSYLVIDWMSSWLRNYQYDFIDIEFDGVVYFLSRNF